MDISHLDHPDALLVSVPEAARRLGIGRTQAFQLVGSGRLRSVQIARRRLISVDELRRFVAELDGEEPRGAA